MFSAIGGCHDITSQEPQPDTDVQSREPASDTDETTSCTARNEHVRISGKDAITSCTARDEHVPITDTDATTCCTGRDEHVTVSGTDETTSCTARDVLIADTDAPQTRISVEDVEWSVVVSEKTPHLSTQPGIVVPSHSTDLPSERGDKSDRLRNGQRGSETAIPIIKGRIVARLLVSGSRLSNLFTC